MAPVPYVGQKSDTIGARTKTALFVLSTFLKPALYRQKELPKNVR
jgi:hypothetical protein